MSVADHDSLTSVLQQAVAGDAHARDEVLSRYRPLMRLVAERARFRTLPRRFDESDVVQQACLEAHKSFDTFRGTTQQEFSRWLEVILERNTAQLWDLHAAKMRDFRRESELSQTESGLEIAWRAGPQPGPLSRVIQGEDAVLVARALEQLPTDYRQAIELRFVHGLKLREVAENMDCTSGAVAGYLRRGLVAMCELLPSSLAGRIGAE